MFRRRGNTGINRGNEPEAKRQEAHELRAILAEKDEEIARLNKLLEEKQGRADLLQNQVQGVLLFIFYLCDCST